MDYTSILGIDVASKKLDMCLLDCASNEHSFETIDYTEDELEKFLTHHPEMNPKSCLVGMESTGEYHLAAARFFLGKGFKAKILNPILTKQYTKTTIRGTKTDKTDSQLICKLLLENHGDYLILADLTDERKELIRLSTSLAKLSTQLKLRLQSTKRKSLNNIEDIEKQMKDIAGDIDNLAKQVVDQATENRTQDEELIDSIPGFAIKLSAVAHYELGDIDRFKNSKSLIAYAGLDPRIKQSGNNLQTTGRITKRGSKYLRSALFLAANVARNNDSELHAYYDKKKTEGRSHKEILTMISRKLLARIYVVLKERRCYVKR